WVRSLAEREGLHDAWSLTSRADLRFEDGVGALRYLDGGIDEPRGDGVADPRPEPARRTAILPLARRAHLRIRGAADMHLALRGAIARTVYTHPRLEISLDGEPLNIAVADATGRYAVDVTVARDHLAGGWYELCLTFSDIADPGRDTTDPWVARLES